MTTALQSWLFAELERLDILLHREILRLRARYQLSLDEFRGLYVSDHQVDALIARQSAPHADVQEMTKAAEKLRACNAEMKPPEWARVQAEFLLSDFELDVLLVAIAREMHLKYDTIYAYVNNDITRKKPTGNWSCVCLAKRGAICCSPKQLCSVMDFFRTARTRISWGVS